MLGIVALGLLALGALLSIFVAGVLALGLDPIVSALERRGWPRGRAALVVCAGIFAAALLIVVCVAPLWSEVHDVLEQVPGYWQELTESDAFQALLSDADRESVRSTLHELVSGVPESATTVLGAAGGAFGSVLSLVTLTFLALFLLTKRRTITDWLFGFARPEVEARWRIREWSARGAPAWRRCARRDALVPTPPSGRGDGRRDRRAPRPPRRPARAAAARAAAGRAG